MQGKQTVNVLVLEDDDLDYGIVERHLSAIDAKYRLIRACGLVEAREIVRNEPIDVGLVDYRLAGDLNGIDFIRELGGRAAPFPIIVLTGLDDAEIDREAVLSGAYDYLDKMALTPETADRAIRFAMSTRNHEQRLREAIREANEQTAINRRILAVVSHEMHSPLRSIIGYCDHLRDECGTDACRGAANKMKIAATHLEDFLRNLSEYVRLDAGSPKLLEQPFNLNEMVRETVDFFKPYAEHKAIQLNLDLADGEARIVGDRLRLRQILINLLRNAVTYTDEGSVTVSAFLDGDTLEIGVQDDGVGMHAEKIASIMADKAAPPQPGCGFDSGLGIGLTICLRLLRLMNGRMSIDSAPGCGTTVIVAAPVRRSNPAKAA